MAAPSSSSILRGGPPATQAGIPMTTLTELTCVIIRYGADDSLLTGRPAVSHGPTEALNAIRTAVAPKQSCRHRPRDNRAMKQHMLRIWRVRKQARRARRWLTKICLFVLFVRFVAFMGLRSERWVAGRDMLMSVKLDVQSPIPPSPSALDRDALESSNGWTVQVVSAARLSFTLIDLNGETGRKNGMASLAVSAPEFRVRATYSKSTSVIADKNSREYTNIIEQFVLRLQQALDGGPAKIEIESGLPQHSGFGSKTTTLLSVGKAYAALNERILPTEEIAFYADRAGTSGGSVNLTDRGGFIVDGGHRVASDFAKDPKRYLVPSRFAGAGRKPPVLVSASFPSWPILMIMPAGEHVHGQPEADFFRRTLPIPLVEARKTAHVVCMNLAPAILECDYIGFCEAFNRITFDTYFKQLQIQNQNAAVQTVLNEASRNGIDAIGMSSMGPGCFSFTRTPSKAVGWLKELQRNGIVADYWFTHAANHAAQVERIPNWALAPAI